MFINYEYIKLKYNDNTKNANFTTLPLTCFDSTAPGAYGAMVQPLAKPPRS